MPKKTKMIRFFLISLLFVSALQVWARGGADLKGKDIVIGQFWAGFNTNTFQPNSEAQEVQLEWRKEIQRTHGFTIREEQVADWSQMLQVVTTSIMAGKPAAHAFFLEPGWAMTLHRRGLLYPISDSKAVNLKNSTPIPGKQVGYNQDIQNLFTFRGKTYATAIGYGISQHSAGVYFNKRLFREAGLDPNLPYDKQKDGTWTWDVFLDICKRLTRDTRNTGVIDTYALPMDLSTETLDVVVFSNGAEYVGRDANGRFYNATNTPEFLEALQFCRRLKDEGVMMPRPENSNWDWYFPMFLDGKVAMMLEPEWRRQQLDKMTDDWGYVLFPKGPKVNDYIFPTDEVVLVIPATFKPAEVDVILAAVNLWFTPIDVNWRADLYNVYRDRRAVDETLELIRSPKHGKFRNHIMIPSLNRGDIAWSMWYFDGDPAQLVESVSQTWNDLINQANGIR
jgi:ABC-type glycerol-3-phosphate transport system substrate-binding protein